MKKNTAVICLSPYHGGMEMDAIKTALMLRNVGNVTMIVKSDSPSEKRYRTTLENAGVPVHPVSFRFALSLKLIIQLRKIIKHYQIGNILFFGASELRSLFFSLSGLNTNLIVRHGTTKSRKKKDPFHRLIYSRVNWHVAICEHIANNVRDIIPLLPRNKLKVIYSSLRTLPDATANDTTHDNKVKVLHVGRITDGKGQLEAIEACSVLYKNNISFSLTLVGEVDPNYRNKLLSTIREKPYSNSIVVAGYTHSPEHFYKQSHIFLFPSKGEGLSNAFIEALAYGLNCVAYSNTSFPELQRLGFHVYLATDQDIDDLKTQLLMACKNWQEKNIDYYNMDKAKKLFSPEREIREYKDILI